MPDERSKSKKNCRTVASDLDESLLAAARDAYQVDESSSAYDVAAAPPGWIGRYRIISVLGAGGMGTIYEAEQQDPQRAVALKVVRGGQYVDKHYIRLFQREAQALARLRHPGIAAIYESGHTEDGRHFFAMELVRGEGLLHYVAQHQLNLASRLSLFRLICDAINYAHQRGVIHRDLKPSNIIVDSEGRPKVLDFGLARITDTDIAATTLVTEVGRLQGTLAYMSPEQARGNPDEIDLRSDVYALGVILYELTTDHLPYDVDRSALHETVRAICDEPPRRPRSILRSLPADVETIILKAMDKEPARRYQSAAALGDDVQRFLASQPILARPPSAVYQLRKLAARHKLPVVLLAALFVFVAGFGIWNRVLYGRAIAAQRLARKKAQTSDDVLALLTRFVVTLDPNTGVLNEKTPRETLLDGARQLEKDRADSGPAVAALYSTMGDIFQRLSYYDEAMDYAAKSLALQRNLHGKASIQAADAYYRLGLCWKWKGDYSAAEQNIREALEIHQNLLGLQDPHGAADKRLLGLCLIEQGRFDQARKMLLDSLQCQLEVYGPQHIEIARTKDMLAKLYNRLGAYADAERFSREAWSIARQILPKEHTYAGSASGQLIDAMRGRGAYAEAVTLTRQAIEATAKKYTENHRYFAAGRTKLGALLSDQGNFVDAEHYLRAALDLFRRRGESETPSAANCKIELGMVLIATGNIEAASSHFSDAWQSFQSQKGSKDPAGMARARFGMALVSLARDQAMEAESIVRDALADLRAYLPDTHWWVAYGTSIQGECALRLRRREEAQRLLTTAYNTMRGIRGDDDRYVKQAKSRLQILAGPSDESDH